MGISRLLASGPRQRRRLHVPRAVCVLTHHPCPPAGSSVSGYSRWTTRVRTHLRRKRSATTSPISWCAPGENLTPPRRARCFEVTSSGSDPDVYRWVPLLTERALRAVRTGAAVPHHRRRCGRADGRRRVLSLPLSHRRGRLAAHAPVQTVRHSGAGWTVPRATTRCATPLSRA